jgi:hypothetical protein
LLAVTFSPNAAYFLVAANSCVSTYSLSLLTEAVQLRIKRGTTVFRGRQLVKVIGCNDAERDTVKLNVKVRA